MLRKTHRAGARALTVVAVIALARLGALGCADDPDTRALFADRQHGVAFAASDASSTIPNDTFTPDGGPDATAPADTIPTDTDTTPSDTTPVDTTPADTTPTDTTPTDTTPADTTPADTTPTDTTPTDTTPTGPALVVPPTLAIPWVRAGQGGSTLTVDLVNRGAPGAFTATLSGDSSLALDPFDAHAGASARLTLRFSGAASPTTARATLTVTDHHTTHQATVWAVAGRALPNASWSALQTGAVRYGETATVALETAPFPDAGATWTDDRVNVFVPDDFIDRGPVPFVVHFHGHGTTLAATLPYHKYREQLFLSGVNAVLVTPQGPVDAASGNFGKLMDPGGLQAMLRDVVELLFRDGHVLTPQVGDLVLTEHSGGYQAVALNLDAETDQGQVLAAHLFDGLYGYSSAYEAFARAGGFLRSNYTTGGGTRDNNRALASTLGGLAAEDAAMTTLRDRRAAIWFTPAAHGDCTWWQQAFAETLRWGAQSARRGPRIELRTAAAQGQRATVTWLAPHDDWTVAHRVQLSADRLVWVTAAEVDPAAGAASFDLPAGRYVRVVPLVEDLDPALALPSDTYWIEASPILVVDGFDRALGGSYHDLRHDTAARVGRAASAASASNEAVTDGELRLADFDLVIWLLGDESVADHTFTAAEQALITAYLDAGGRVIASGSEIAYDLRTTGASFLASLGAVYQADDANQSGARGAGPLASLGGFTFGGPAAPYPEDYPDALATASGATIVLQYDNGMTAAAGRANKSVVVGFPLELIDDEARLSAVLAALMGFVGQVP